MKHIILEIIILILLIIMVIWHTKKTIYICSKCKKEFKISFFKDLLSFRLGKKGIKLICPYCKTKTFHQEKVDYYKNNTKKNMK